MTMEVVRWVIFIYTLPLRLAFFLYITLPLALLSALYSFLCTQFVLLYEVGTLGHVAQLFRVVVIFLRYRSAGHSSFESSCGNAAL